MDEMSLVDACQKLIESCTKLGFTPFLMNSVGIASAEYAAYPLPEVGLSKAMYRIEIDPMRRAAVTVYRTTEVARKSHQDATQIMGQAAGLRFGPVVVQASDEEVFSGLFELLVAVWPPQSASKKPHLPQK